MAHNSHATNGPIRIFCAAHYIEVNIGCANIHSYLIYKHIYTHSSKLIYSWSENIYIGSTFGINPFTFVFCVRKLMKGSTSSQGFFMSIIRIAELNKLDGITLYTHTSHGLCQLPIFETKIDSRDILSDGRKTDGCYGEVLFTRYAVTLNSFCAAWKPITFHTPSRSPLSCPNSHIIYPTYTFACGSRGHFHVGFR